jgi:hypothetical protein
MELPPGVSIQELLEAHKYRERQREKQRMKNSKPEKKAKRRENASKYYENHKADILAKKKERYASKKAVRSTSTETVTNPLQ